VSARVLLFQWSAVPTSARTLKVTHLLRLFIRSDARLIATGFCNEALHLVAEWPSRVEGDLNSQLL
jgi:hypothetical protein